MILDYGLACMDISVCEKLKKAGTEGYIDPLRIQALDVADFYSSDVYSLGVIVEELAPQEWEEYFATLIERMITEDGDRVTIEEAQELLRDVTIEIGKTFPKSERQSYFSLAHYLPSDSPPPPPLETNE